MEACENDVSVAPGTPSVGCRRVRVVDSTEESVNVFLPCVHLPRTRCAAARSHPAGGYRNVHAGFMGYQTHVKCLQSLRKCERLRNRSDINPSCGLGAS